MTEAQNLTSTAAPGIVLLNSKTRFFS